MEFIEKTERKKILTALSAGIITFIVFLPALRNKFVNMDDDAYIYQNHFIRMFDVRFFKEAFLEFNVSNWHPLTWLSHALDYAVWGLDPSGHHLTNNILHAANTFLVVVLVAKLLARRQAHEPASWQAGQPAGPHNSRFALIAAGTTGLLFGIHPLHVESVAWVSERKDLLCGLFFLLSIMMYVKYAANASQRAQDTGQKDAMQGAEGREQRAEDKGTQEENSLRYAPCAMRYRAMRYALCFFVLALLSKPMAVTLPAVLLILDWYPLGRISSRKSWRWLFAEKLPFLVFSLASSVVTILAQRSGGSLMELETLPFSTRLIQGMNALVVYLWKMVLPLNLSPVYAYPQDISLASLRYLLPVLFAAGITAAAAGTVKRQRLWLAAWGYYVITLLPVIGLIQVGRQPMADRYTYLPGLGPFLIAGLAAAWLYEKAAIPDKGRGPKLFILIMAGVMCGSMIYLTTGQTAVWKDNFTLWNYVIEKEPHRIPSAYNQRGSAFYEGGEYEKAIADYSRAIALEPDRYFKAYNNRGVAYNKIGMFEKAIEDFNRSIGINPEYGEAYNNRGIAHDERGLSEKAIEDFSMAIAADPESDKAYNNRGAAFYKKRMFNRAIEDFGRAIAINPGFANAYNNRGVAYDETGMRTQAIADFDSAIAINPGYFEAYRNRGFSYYIDGKYEKALESFNDAIALNRDDAESYVNRAFVHLKTGNKKLAIGDLETGCALGYKEACTSLADLVRE